jgi:hypothetical protein
VGLTRFARGVGVRLTLVLALVWLVGCDGGAGAPDADPRPTVPIPVPAPTSGDQSVQLDDGRYRVKPTSAPVETSVPYEFTIHTHCGLDWSVDFDGSFWDLVGEDPDDFSRDDFDDPSDDGVMVLVNRELAEFTSSKGTTVAFVRHIGKKIIPGCD